jgi:hypothetical protein
MKKCILILGLMAFMTLKAQPPSRFYTKFGGSGDDIAYSAKPTLDRQYIVAGSTSSFGSTDVYLVKVDSMGLPVWSKTYGGINNDVGKSVIQLSDSGYVIAGFTSSFGAGGYDVYLVRTDKNGNLIWQRTFGGNDWDFANDLVLTSNGNIAVVGNTSSFGSGQKDGMVLIYDLSGNIISQKFYGGSQNEELRSIIKTNDGFLATVGYTESKNDINGDGYFLKLDLVGDTIFTKTYGGVFRGYANDIVQKTTNEFVICGAETYTPNGATMSQMISLSTSGNFLWENHYTKTPGDEEFVSVCNSFQLPYLSAFVRSAPFSAYKYQGEIVSVTPGGWPYKVNDVGGYEDEYFYSVEPTLDGGFVICGSTTSFNSIGTDVFFLKNDSTCFFYQSIVGIKKNFALAKGYCYNQFNNTIDLRFNSEDIPKNISLIDLNGIVINKFYPQNDKLEIDVSKLPNSMYIIIYIYRDDSVFRCKIIKN